MQCWKGQHGTHCPCVRTNVRTLWLLCLAGALDLHDAWSPFAQVKEELKDEDAEDDLVAYQSILQKLASKDLVGLPQPWSFDPVAGITYNGSNELPEEHREAAATALAHKVMQASPHGRIPQTPWASRAAAHAAAAEVEASGADEEATDDEDENADLRATIWQEVRRQLFVGTWCLLAVHFVSG